jgi:hypothetical protein
MRHSNRELWLSLIAVLGITLAYLLVVALLNGIPKASDFFGHTIGILGFILMLMTETLYTLRKRSHSARWGRMSSWLEFHIFTGLVGPYMVLLHSSWKFNGLAGVVMLLTVIIVLSGFVGRYIYTAVPRTADGVEMEAYALESQIAAVEAELKGWLAERAADRSVVLSGLAARLAGPDIAVGNSLALIFGRALAEWRFQLRWQLEKRRLDTSIRSQALQLEKMLDRRRQLQRQINSLATARRLLALWHAVHIPIGMALFTAAFIHIAAAIYYATLLR